MCGAEHEQPGFESLPELPTVSPAEMKQGREIVGTRTNEGHTE